VGILLAALAMLAVLVPLVESPSIGWQDWMWPPVLSAVPLGWAFVHWQMRQERRRAPQLMPMQLMRSGPFLTGSTLNAVLFSAVPSYFFTVALYLQSGYGLTPLQSGLTTTPFPVGVLAASAVTGWFGSRWIRWRVLGGGLLLGAGYLGQGWAVSGMGEQISWLRMAPWFLISGFGLGNTVSPLYQLALSSTDESDRGSASGAIQAIRQVGIAFGIAIMGGVFFSVLGNAARGNWAAYRIAMLAAIGYAGLVASIVIATSLLRPMQLSDAD
jgi:MFS family permease